MPHLDIAIAIGVLAPATKGMAEVLTHMSPAAWIPSLREYGHSCSCSPNETLPGRASRLEDTAHWAPPAQLHKQTVRHRAHSWRHRQSCCDESRSNLPCMHRDLQQSGCSASSPEGWGHVWWVACDGTLRWWVALNRGTAAARAGVGAVGILVIPPAEGGATQLTWMRHGKPQVQACLAGAMQHVSSSARAVCCPDMPGYRTTAANIDRVLLSEAAGHASVTSPCSYADVRSEAVNCMQGCHTH